MHPKGASYCFLRVKDFSALRLARTLTGPSVIRQPTSMHAILAAAFMVLRASWNVPDHMHVYTDAHIWLGNRDPVDAGLAHVRVCERVLRYLDASEMHATRTRWAEIRVMTMATYLFPLPEPPHSRASARPGAHPSTHPLVHINARTHTRTHCHVHRFTERGRCTARAMKGAQWHMRLGRTRGRE